MGNSQTADPNSRVRRLGTTSLPGSDRKNLMMKQPGTPASDPSPMSSASEAELAEDQYFEAPIAGDIDRVGEVLVEDFSSSTSPAEG
jgi:hypothetical protein